MKTITLAILAAAIGTIGVAAPAAAHPRHKVCTVKWVHHHKVRRCAWR